MRLIDLIPLRESDHEMLCMEYTRKFSEVHGIQPLFKFIGLKGDTQVHTADITNVGEMSLIITEAKIVALIDKKQAMFGLMYTLTGLEKLDATICKMKRIEKDGHTTITYIEFDSEDNKNFNKDNTNFIKMLK
jgi:hypothetical protein